MNRAMNHDIPDPRLTDADLDRALNADQDTILPASGFADSVMTAIYHEASAPAPIPFPWRRALPGLAAAILVLLGLIAAVVFVVRSAPAGKPAPASDSSFLTAQLAPFLHSGSATLPDAFWLVSSLALALACLLVCRRLIFAR
jgi:hypothetical protein